MEINIPKIYQDHHELSHKQVPVLQTETDVIEKLSHVAMVAYTDIKKMAPHVNGILHTVITHSSPPPYLGGSSTLHVFEPICEQFHHALSIHVPP